jgi:hypothetical protein
MNKPFAILLYCMAIFFSGCHADVPNDKLPPKVSSDSLSVTGPISVNKGDEAKDEAIIADKSIDVKVRDRIEFPNYSLIFTPSKKSAFPDYYSDQKQRDSIDKFPGEFPGYIRNSEKYLKKYFGKYFSKEDSTLIIQLQNGKTLQFPEWDTPNGIGYRFENYFPEVNYFLLEVIYVEGNSWMLINRRNGAKNLISGQPYFSPDKTKFIAANTDLEAGFSFNGLELYSIQSDSLMKEGKVEIKNWGPENVKWISNSELEIKKTFWTNENDSMIWHTSYSNLKLIKK